jgi:hypothetical protein
VHWRPLFPLLPYFADVPLPPQGWDGEQWRTLDTRLNIIFGSRYASHTFCIEKPVSMVGYRLYVTETRDAKRAGGSCQFAQLKLYDCDSANGGNSTSRALSFCSSPLILTTNHVDHTRNPDEECRREFGNDARQAGWLDLEGFPRHMVLEKNATLSLESSAWSMHSSAAALRRTIDARCKSVSASNTVHRVMEGACGLWGILQGLNSNAPTAEPKSKASRGTAAATTPWSFKAWIKVNGWR